jgi:hypothetical protein
LLADPYISSSAALIYSTISYSPDNQKWRVIFILEEAITDAVVYCQAQTALLARFGTSDQSIKDAARFLYGSNLDTCISHYLGNLLPMAKVLELVDEFAETTRQSDSEIARRVVPGIDPGQVMGDTLSQRYINRAVQEELAWLESRREGTGERHLGLLAAARRLESLRLSPWLDPEARADIDVRALVLDAAERNGYLAKYGQEDTMRAVSWGIGVAEVRPMPPNWEGPLKGDDGPDPSLDIDRQPAWQPRLLLTPEERAAARTLATWPARFVGYASKRTDAPLEFLEGAAVACLSAVVGRKAKLLLTTGPVVLTIWIMLVADSTRYRKSTVIALASDLLERAGLDVLAPDDFSPQRFINLMAERSGKPTLFRRDEFGGFYEGLNKLEHQAGGKQVLIAFHDGRNYRKELVGQKQKDKKTGKTGRKPEIIEVKDPFLSILAGTQHDLLLSQAQAGDIFSGFLPRFAFIVPEGPRQRRDVLELDLYLEQERDSLVSELRYISSMPAGSIYLDTGVLQRWNQYSADLETEAEAAPLASVAGPVFDRMGHLALKLAVLFAYCNGMTVTLPHLLASIEITERWRVQSYKLLSAIGPTRDEKAVQRIFDLVRRKPGIKRRDVMSSLRLSAREMDGAHATLTQRGWVKVVEQGRGTAYFPGEAAASISLEMLECLSGAKMFSGATGARGSDHPLDEAHPEKLGLIKHSSTASDEADRGPEIASLFDCLPGRENITSVENIDKSDPHCEEVGAENSALDKHSSISSTPSEEGLHQWEEEI